MSDDAARLRVLEQRLAEAEATLDAVLSGQVDAVVDPRSKNPVLLAKAQEALRASEERYRGIVETANEGIWTIDSDLNVSFVNTRFAEMLGYRVDEMVGQSFLRFEPEGSAPAALARFAHSRQGGSEELEVAFLRKDGSEVWALLRNSPIRDGAGRYVGTLAMMTDWTRHRQAEEALRKSEEQYRQIVETTTDGIVKIDEAARVVFVNRRFAEMLGYAPHELMGTSIFGFMSAAAPRVASDESRQSTPDTLDTTLRHRDGTDISVSIAASRLLDAEGRHVGNLGIVRDVTERNKLQSQLMVSDRMASVGTLAAGVAHEINNPLAAIIANLDYIADGLARPVAWDAAGLRAEIHEPLADAREAAQQVRFIVGDLKIFSRAPADEPKGPVNVEAILESSLRMAWNEVRHRARLVKHYGAVPCVTANEARLGQVFLNLIVNAAQALPDGRAEHNEIRVATRLEGDRVVIEVSDTGAGIPPEIILRIFDAFFTTKAVGVGTGLGLAICQRIVTDMNGELTVESEVGKGTTFRVALPVARTSERVTAATIAPDPVDARRARILVVDDEELVVRGVKRSLADEHDVVVALTGREALSRCAGGEEFDLILCDLMMPEMTGMDLHRELTRVAPAQARRMVFLTGGAFTPNARQFLASTRSVPLEKPFDAASLRATVRRYLRAFSAATSA